MPIELEDGLEKSPLKGLLDHLGKLEDPCEPWHVLFPLHEVLFLVLYGTICDCNDYDLIANWDYAYGTRRPR